MLRNNIPDQQLIELLKVYYGIDIHTLQLLVGGADMNAFGYKADSESNSYFIKLKYGHHDEINLSIIRLLHDSGVKEIVFPINTVEDIAVYGHDLLSRDQNAQSRLESFKHFKSMFDPNDVIEIAFASDCSH